MKRLLICLLTGTLLLAMTAGSRGAEDPSGLDPSPLTFTASADYPLPDESTAIHQGRCFWVDGVVTGSGPLRSVSAQIVDEAGETVREAARTFAPEEDVRTYRLLDPTFSADVDCISEELAFQDLSVGG